jgi:hypothetical protein
MLLSPFLSLIWFLEYSFDFPTSLEPLDWSIQSPLFKISFGAKLVLGQLGIAWSISRALNGFGGIGEVEETRCGFAKVEEGGGEVLGEFYRLQVGVRGRGWSKCDLVE